MQKSREPATPEQLSELAQSLNRLDCECSSISDLICTMYDQQDLRFSRVEELCNALQRLKWALERGSAPTAQAGGQKAEHK